MDKYMIPSQYFTEILKITGALKNTIQNNIKNRKCLPLFFGVMQKIAILISHLPSWYPVQ